MPQNDQRVVVIIGHCVGVTCWNTQGPPQHNLQAHLGGANPKRRGCISVSCAMCATIDEFTTRFYEEVGGPWRNWFLK